MEHIQEPMSNQKAVSEINAIMQEVAVMGANDREIPYLMRLIDDVEKGKLNPTTAIEQAHGIKNSKASYH